MTVAKRSRLTKSARPRLTVILHGMVAGQVYVNANRRMVFRYDDGWRAQRGVFPLSVSMPLSLEEHGHQATSAFLWGLLPDNPDVVARWAKLNSVSRNDVVGLLARVGEDCAGAVQLVPPENVDRVLGAPTPADESTSINWLPDWKIAELLAALKKNPAAGRTSAEQGQFSLAGAQPKTALYQDEMGRWGIPRGRVPSNRILKPPVLDLEDLAYNEHFCLQLARELGLAAVASRVERFGKETAIVVDRYDRTRINGVLNRVHQEDVCQASAVIPTRKYESDGGPGVNAIATLLARHSTEATTDVLRFLEALILNWFLAGSDAHAKNYSILHAAGPDLRLAPLYDVITVLPYPKLARNGMLLAMAVNGERAVDRITGADWRAVARTGGLDSDLMMDRIEALGIQIPSAIDRVLANHSGDSARRIIARLAEPVAKHVRACLRRLA
jgi:serine/threonine-protein kinase HipA